MDPATDKEGSGEQKLGWVDFLDLLSKKTNECIALVLELSYWIFLLNYPSEFSYLIFLFNFPSEFS